MLLVPQVLLAVTFTLPVPVPHVTSMLLEPCPAVMVPLVTLQLYAGSGDTVATAKFTNPPLHHDVGLAVSVPGVLGLPVRTVVLAGLLPGVHSVVLAVTDKVPLLKLDNIFSWMVVVPCPLAINVFAGGVHV